MIMMMMLCGSSMLWILLSTLHILIYNSPNTPRGRYFSLHLHFRHEERDYIVPTVLSLASDLLMCLEYLSMNISVNVNLQL